MCSTRTTFGIRSGPFGVRSGLVRNPFEVRSRCMQGPFGVRSGSIRSPCRVRSGSVQDPFGVRSGSVRNRFRIRSGSVRDLFGARSPFVRGLKMCWSPTAAKKDSSPGGVLRGRISPLLPTAHSGSDLGMYFFMYVLGISVSSIIQAGLDPELQRHRRACKPKAYK